MATILFSLYSHVGTPLAGATPTIVANEGLDGLGSASIGPVVDLGDGLYQADLGADAARPIVYLVDCGPLSAAAYLAGGVNGAVGFQALDGAGDPFPAATPVFSHYYNLDTGAALPQPSIASVGLGLFGFLPSEVPEGGLVYRVDLGVAANPRYLDGMVEAGGEAGEPGEAPQTVADFIALVKLSAQLPDTQGLFSDADVVLAANNELYSLLVPAIMRMGAEHFVKTVDLTLTPGTNRFLVPTAAVGGKLRSVTWTPVNGRKQPLHQHMREDVQEHVNPGFYMEGRSIVVTPASLSGSLGLAFYRRPQPLAVGGLSLPLSQDLVPLLAQATACKLLEVQDMREEAKVAERRRDMLVATLETLIAPRADGNPRRYVNRYLLGV